MFREIVDDEVFIVYEVRSAHSANCILGEVLICMLLFSIR